MWLLCEFCDRGSLADYVFSRRLVRRADGSQNVPLIFELLMDVARGMEYLHSRANIVHGDLRLCEAPRVQCVANSVGWRIFLACSWP